MTAMSWASVQPGDLDWQRHSKCKDAPEPGIFHPEAPKRADLEAAADQAAAAWCRACPALAACRAFADSLSAEGVWAGQLRTKRGTDYSAILLPSMQPTPPKLPKPSGLPPSKLDVCGSDAGYAKHRRRSEMPCADCKAAHARVDVARRRRLAEAKEKAA